MSPAGERETTVGSFNIENFFDDETNSPNVEKEVVTPERCLSETPDQGIVSDTKCIIDA